MALTDADFLLTLDFDDVRVFVEADRLTVYAYTGVPQGEETKLNGDAWLFNLADAPEEPEWGPGMDAPPRNPRVTARPFDLDREVREDAFTVSEIEVDRRREWIVEYGGKPIGLVWVGANPGCSVFATDDSPAAARMPTYALD